jgi:hypothetical protein
MQVKRNYLMSKSQWILYKMDDKITQILLDAASHDPGHHFGRPFLTAYQIAIEFQRRFRDEFTALNEPVGGKGTGQKTSLAQYIARELSRQIREGKLPKVEGRFLWRMHLKALEYSNNGKTISASNEQNSDMSMFRLKS